MQFRQSTFDFPCPVVLGKNTPSFGLHRFNKALRFVPPDDEGFILRGDRRRLLYKGRRRSHRFTILGDTAFEYDCILEREPESNVISLLMHGAENFDFFRQPDFVKEPFLKGSYAVYKKETLIGEGTGKLCHIHRPEIIDARGRRCWGDLAIVGNELRITIPEGWLSGAKYPVVVDPTIGTTTVGNFTYPVESPDRGSSLVYEIGVNKFLVPEKIVGQCTAWVYFSYINGNNYSYHPRLYDDDNNRPLTRRSCNEGNSWWGRWLDDNYHTLQTENTPKWKSATFDVIGTINQGSYIWFGGYGNVYYPCFDYGAVLHKAYQEYIYEDDDDEEGIEYLDFPYFGSERTYDRKFSWYFEFVSQSVNYIRTITLGVTLSDNRKLTADYKRSMAQTAGVNSLLTPYKTFFLKIQEIVKGTDSGNSSVLFIRSVNETVNNTELSRHIAAYSRGLSDTAEIEDKAKSSWTYSAVISDTVNAVGSVFRGLILLVRIITGVFIRDYLLGRFLKAREELILKSAISREIVLESRIS